jgi:hypothetical protein
MKRGFIIFDMMLFLNLIDFLKMTKKHLSKNFVSAILLTSFIFSVYAQPVKAIGEWEIVKNTDSKSNPCIARNNIHQGVELSKDKLVIPLKDSHLLSTYQVEANAQIVLPKSKPNLSDKMCNCLRIRNTSNLNVDPVAIRLEVTNSNNQTTDLSFVLKDLPTVLKELKSASCLK